MTGRRLLTVTAMLVGLAVIGAGAVHAAAQLRDPTMDRRTRAYVRQLHGCQAAVAIVRLSITKQQTIIEIADTTTQARDICDAIRTRLLRMDTKHFVDQANDGWYAVDRYKSGLNALLKYLDTTQPSKLIEARDKLAQGDAGVALAVREINQRRHVYGLPPIK